VLQTIAALLVSTGFAGFAAGAFAADVAHGAQLAQQWCTGCHVLPSHPGQTALQGPPSFRDIARGGKTSDQVRLFLLNPHGAMPPLTLSRAEIDDLVGYIETLR
jgi:mono/diheme cytochrome c family protein